MGLTKTKLGWLEGVIGTEDMESNGGCSTGLILEKGVKLGTYV